jgi:crotonobetainyl-CoA:carnitine CoA-transferase CaiB-like acyl-CoA transferase
MLGRLGAEVIKVESPGPGDILRYMPSRKDGKNPAYAMINEGKKNIVLNLKKDGGADVVHRLLETTDVLVEQFRPGVLGRLGIPIEELRTRYPRLIIASITGYGQTGPMAETAGHDLNYVALAGLLSKVDDPTVAPQLPFFQAADVAGGAWYPLVSILAALMGRNNHGMGAHLDLSMTEGAMTLGTMNLGARLGGTDPGYPEMSMLQGGFPCYGLYQCKDGRFISLAALEPKFWITFCTRVDRTDWIPKQTDPRFRDELIEGLADLFMTRTRDEWGAFLSDADCCVEPVLELDELPDHPQHKARNLFAPGPRLRLPGIESLRGTSPAGADEAGPSTVAGSSTRSVLRDAGYTEAEISALLASGIAQGE